MVSLCVWGITHTVSWSSLYTWRNLEPQSGPETTEVYKHNPGSLFVSPGPSLHSQPPRESGRHPQAANFQNNRGIFIDFFFF